MANVRDVNEFVEQLSNCIGEISDDEVVFKKIPYSSEYVVTMSSPSQLMNKYLLTKGKEQEK